MKQFSSFLVLVVLLLISWSGLAQNFPVQVQAIARPPYTNYLTDLTNPASEQLIVTLLLKDLQFANRQVRLQTYIEGPGGRIQGQANVAAPPINLLPGSMIQLSGPDLAIYFRPENLQIPPAQYGRALPEGLYRFCFTVFDYQTNQQLSATSCSNMAWIQRSDPPLVMLPTNNQVVPALPAQQVLFQWVPRHSQINATEYELTLTELIVPQGFSANLQNLFFALPPYFKARVQGTTFLYGPGQPPLTNGRLYGFRVRAVPKMGAEGQTSFTNDGYSQVGFFMYGSSSTNQLMMSAIVNQQQRLAPVSTPDNIAKVMKGRVAWSFKKTELEPDTAKSAWVVNTPTQAWAETTRQVVSPAEKSSVANPLENAQVSITANGKLIGTAKTDKDGNYEIKGFNPDVLQGVTSLIVKASLTDDFTTATRTVAIQRGQTDYDLGQNILVAQTFRLATQVISSDVPKEELTLRVLRRKEIVDRLPYLTKEGSGTREAVTYNGQDYVSVATVKSSEAARRLFYNTTGGDQLVVQIVARGKSPVYVPLNAVNPEAVTEGNKPLLFLKRNYTYRSALTLTGTVGMRTPTLVGREGVRVRAILNRADMISPPAGIPSRFSRTVTSDKDGNFTLADLPVLKRNAPILLEATDNTLGPVPQVESITFTGEEVIQKDITLRTTVAFTAGVLKDQFGKPVASGLVKVKATGQVARTNEFGYFLVKTYGGGQVDLAFNADGFDEKKDSLNPSAFAWSATDPESNATKWAQTLADYASAKDLLTTAGQSELTPGLMGYSAASTGELLGRLALPHEQVMGMGDLGVVTLRSLRGLVRFVTTINDEPVAARIELSNEQAGESAADSTGWAYLGAADMLTYKVKPIKGGSPFVAIESDITIEAGETRTINIALERALTLTGTITNDSTDAPIAEATVSIKGLNISTTTDEEGKYWLIVPVDRELEIKVAADDYETVDSTMTLIDSQVLDLALAERDTSLPEIETLMGFEVSIDNIEAGDDDKFTISGTLKLPKDGAFKAEGEQQLTFSNVEVEVDDEGNAIPSEEIEFEEVELKLSAFGFAPVVVRSKEGLTLAPMVSDEEKGMIGGERLELDVHRVRFNRGFNLKRLPPTTLALIKPITGDKDERAKQVDERKEAKEAGPAGKYDEAEFLPVFASPDVPLLATSPTARYRLVFSKNYKDLNHLLTKAEKTALAEEGEAYQPVSMQLFTFMLDREKCELNTRGIDLVGKVRLAKAAGITYINKDIVIDKFTLGRQFETKELTFRLSKASPLVARMGKWRARLESISVYDNFRGVGFSGSIGSTDNAKNDFTIDKLYYINGADGLKVGGKITLPADGYKIGSMVLKTPNGFELAYIGKTKVFEIDGSLGLDYTGKTKNSVLKVFPMEVQRFVYRTNNQLFIAVKANTSVAVGPVKVNIRRFLFNRGVGMTLDQMNQYLERDEKEDENMGSSARFDKKLEKAAEADSAKADAISKAKEGMEESLDEFDELGAEEEEEEEVMVEEKATWGIGVAGGVEINVPSLQVKSDASVLLVEEGGSVKVRINEILFTIDNGQFKAEVKAKIVNDPNRDGFEGEGSVEVVSRKLMCGFKYYKIGPDASDVEFGLTILSSTQIIMGSVTWTELGGQIDFNLKEKKYYIALLGKMKPTGSDEKAVLFDKVKVSILFDLNECGGKPVIKGSMTIQLKGEEWGFANATLDICRMRLIAIVTGEKEIITKLGKIKIDAVLYAKTSMLFFGCSVRVRVPKINTEVNGLVSFAITAKREEMPETEFYWSRMSWDALDNNGQTFNGINVRVDAELAKGSGGSSMDLKIGEVGYSYKYWANAQLEFFVKFSSGNFGFGADIDVGGEATAKLLILSLTGGVSARARLTGGYTDERGWFFGGRLNATVFVANDSGRECNTAEWVTVGLPFRVCLKIPCFPDAWNTCSEECIDKIPYNLKFKLCAGTSLPFDWSSQ